MHTRTGGVRIFDGIELSNQSLLFNSTPSRLTVVLVLADTLEYLQLAGRTWTLAMAEQADSPDAPAHHKA